MKHLRSWLSAIAAIAALGAATTASSATYHIVGGFDGGQLGAVDFDLTLTGDFTTEIVDSTAGLTINSLSIPVEGGLGYTFNPFADSLILGGLFFGSGINTGFDDFRFLITDFQSSPAIGNVLDSLGSLPGAASPTSSYLTVTADAVAPIPLPAALPLLAGALAGLGFMRRGRDTTRSAAQGLRRRRSRAKKLGALPWPPET